MARRRHRRFVRLADRLEVESVDEAAALIVSGMVTVDGVVLINPDAMVAADAAVTISTDRSLRGTMKLRPALEGFGVTVSGRVCLDVGAAAGGFTAALLDAGAGKVYAVDAGYGQLVGRLRQDCRVVNLERTNLADLNQRLVPEPVEVICLDLSYLAVADAVPQLTSLLMSEEAQLIALVKPTFELHAPRMVTQGEAIEKAVQAALVGVRQSGWWTDGTTVRAEGGGGAPEVFIHGARREPQ